MGGDAQGKAIVYGSGAHGGVVHEGMMRMGKGCSAGGGVLLMEEESCTWG